MSKLYCSICGTSNFILEYKCKNCGNILREKFNVINISEVLKDLLFDIEIGIKKILFAEKKNYLIVLLVLFSIKLSILTLIDLSFFDLEISSFPLAFKIFVFWMIYLLVITFLNKMLLSFLCKSSINFKQSLTIITFGNIFLSLSLILLLPLELMLFGIYLFSQNPSIFEIDSIKAYAVMTLEGIVFIYSIYLIFKFHVFILQKRIKVLIVTGLIVLFLIFGFKLVQIIVGM